MKNLLTLFVVCSLMSSSMAQSCEDSENYRLNTKTGDPKRCVWIKGNPRRIRRWCEKVNNKRKVSEACPKACGVCKSDDPDFTFSIKNMKKKCAWIATRKKHDKYCVKKTGGILNSRYCRYSCGENWKPAKPNILLILLDDVGVGDIKGYWTDGKVDMPNIKNLVDNSTIFTNAHSTPLCAPSRYVLLSGNYQHRGTEVGGTWKLEDDSQFLTKQKGIAQALKTGANYHTAAFGKWHMGARISPNGLQGGYDTILTNKKHDFTKKISKGAGYVGFEKSFITMSGVQGPPYAFFKNDLLQIDGTIKFWNKGQYNMPKGTSKIIDAGQGSSKWDSTDFNMLVVEEFQDFIGHHVNTRLGDPFFAYVALGGVHIPHSPPKNYLNGEQIAGKYATDHMDMLYETDLNVGSLMQELEDNKLLEDTIIILTSDNGGLGATFSGEHGHQSNSILRGKKGSAYEGGHRVPFIMRYDGVIPKGRQEDSLIGLNDLYATLCDIANVDVPSHSAVDSISFSDLVIPKKPTRKRRKELGIWRIKEGELFSEAILKSDGNKLIHYPTNGTVELYNLQYDIGEKDDISSKSWAKKRIKDMLSKLEDLGPN